LIFVNAASVALSTSANPLRWVSSPAWNSQLVGTSGADALSSSGSYNTLLGGAGDDTYCVWNATNAIRESAGGGIDTLQSYASWIALPDQVENLQLMWANATGIGNRLDNIILGSAGAQTLNGAAGNDVLYGGDGSDLFVVTAGQGSDVILDFTPGLDRIRLEGYALYTLSGVRAAMSQSGADAVLALGNGERLVLRNTQVGALGSADFVLPLDPVHPGMHRTFDEEFNAFSASASGYGTVWKTSLGITKQDRTLPTNKEAEYYSDSSVGVNPFSLAAGVLDIAASPGRNALNLPYNSGLISTATSFAQQYGYFEARLDLPAGAGFWPCFWLLPSADTWPPEIDILEALGQDPTTANVSLHSGTGGNTTIPVRHLPDLTAGFHTYGLDWRADSIAWFIDGMEVARLATPADMHQAMYLTVNLAVGGPGSWPGPTAAAKPTAHLLIDYVRVWQTGDGGVTGPADVAGLGGTYTLKADGVSDLYDFTKARLPLDMDAAALPLAGTHTVWGSPLGSTVRGGPGTVNFAGGAGVDSFTFGLGTSRAMGGGGNDSFTLVKGMIGANDQIIDFHVNLGNGTEHDTLRLHGFTAAAHLDFVSLSGTIQSYRVVDGTYASPIIGITVVSGVSHLAAPDYQFA